MSAERWPVVIIGCGPVGLTLANLLGVHGIRALVLERNAGTADEPRAIAIDAEGLRTMQAAGLYDQVAPDMLLGFDVDYLNGRGNRLFAAQLSQTPYGHAQQNSFDQPTLEKQLLAGLARFPHVEVRFRHTVTDLRHDANGAVVAGIDGNNRQFHLEAEYLVGCDGGRSLVRQKLGIQMRGKSAPQRWLVIDTTDRHLADTLQCRFFCDPARPAMTLRKQHGKRRWEWMLMPGETDEQFLDDGLIRRLLAPHTRADEVAIERKCVYTFHSIVADRYRDGRVLIAGDAAHMMPPFAGQGMNSGLRDALNLSWKLPLVLRGLAPDPLLDTYEKERRNHVIAATEIANRLGSLIQPTSKVRAAIRDTVFFCLNLTRAGQRAFDRRLLGTLRVPRMQSGVFTSPSNGRSSLAGSFVVQPKVRTAAGTTVWLDEILGPWFAVVGFGVDPRRALSSEAREAWEAIGARFVHVVPPGTAPVDDAVEDFSGTFAEWMGDRSEPLVAIRPDKFCAAQFAPETSTERTRDFISRLGGTFPPAATR